MIFEANNEKTFRGFPLNKYRFNLEVNESCYAIRFVLDNGEEYILWHNSDEVACKKKCAWFNREYNTKVHYIKVTRVSDTDYQYSMSHANTRKAIHGTVSGIFKQEQQQQFDDYTINPSYYKPTHVEKNRANKKDKEDISLNDLYSNCVSSIN